MQKIATLSFLVGLATLATVAAWRLSVDALALIIGIVLGVCIMAPVVALMAWLARSHRAESEQCSQARPPMPPVIVVQPGAYPGLAQARPDQMSQPENLLPGPFSHSPPSHFPERQWALRIFGEEETATPLDSPPRSS